MQECVPRKPRRAGALWLLLFGLVLAGGAPAAPTIDFYVVGPDGKPVRDAVIALLGEQGQAVAAPGIERPDAVMDQIDLAFSPHVLSIQSGNRVEFPNSDQVRHSIYSFSDPKVFEVKLYRGREASPITFDRTGQVVLGCNIHDYMLGYVYVQDTPYSGVTGEDGRVAIAGVEDGRYLLRVRHPRVDRGVLFERVIDTAVEGPVRVPLDRMPPPRTGLRPERPDPLQGLFGVASP